MLIYHIQSLEKHSPLISARQKTIFEAQEQSRSGKKSDSSYL